MKKGFTLIELLAVIVILAVIAIIATPIIINIIEDSSKGAAASAAQLYTNGLTEQIVAKNMTQAFNPSVCTVTNGSINCDGQTLEYSVNGTKPTSGTINFSNGVLSSYSLCINGYRVVKNGDTVTTTKDSTCTAEPVYTYTSPGLYRNGALVYSWDDLCSLGLITVRYEDHLVHDHPFFSIVGSEPLNGYLYIDDSITRIDRESLANAGLTGITIPDSVFYIEPNAFANNPLTSITVDPENEHYDSRDNCNAIIYNNTYENRVELVQGSRNTVIPDSVTSIGAGAFSGVGLTSITIPETIEDIEYTAFANNQLTSINIPASVEMIGESAFANNPLTSITVDPENPYYDSRDNSNALIYTDTETGAISLAQASRNTVMPDGIVAIWPQAFERMGLTSVTIPSTVKYIGYGAFANNQITSVNIPATVEEIDSGAFLGNPLTSITVDPENPYYDSRDNCNAIISTDANSIVQGSRNTVIPNNIVQIWDSAFEGLGLTSITIPDSVTSIGWYAFANNQLTSIILPSEIFDVWHFSFVNNRITSVTIPSSAEFVGTSAFANNRLTSVTVSEGVEMVCSKAFANNQITSLILPESLTEIYAGAFANNRLTSVTIPSSVSVLDYSSFANNQLTNITFNRDNVEIRGYALANNPLATITMPPNKDFEWSMYRDMFDTGTPTTVEHQNLITTLANNKSSRFISYNTSPIIEK